MKRFSFTFGDGSGYGAIKGETLLEELAKIYNDEYANETSKELYNICVDFVNNAQVGQKRYFGERIYIERDIDIE